MPDRSITGLSKIKMARTFTGPRFVAKDVYGYIIVTALALFIVTGGVFIIWREQRKVDREPAYIILGICVASLGSLLMLLTILLLATRTGE